jgi:exopolyphosphatase/guanosine-5'-triphosphate,3'-diphosphate pyrophosphatase
LKFAAIDIGSNAIRLLIEEVHIDNGIYHIEKVSLTRVPVRLGEDVFTKGKISKEKTRQLIKTMKAFWYLMEVHQIKYYRACATSAMREAKNREEIMAKVRKESHVDLELLSGDDEAEMIFQNFRIQNIDHSANYLYIDVGGGSTELTIIRDGQRIRSHSFELGTVRMLAGVFVPELWKEARKWIQEIIKDGQTYTAIGTGGNINTLFKLLGKKPGQQITRSEIQTMHNQLHALSMDERIVRFGLKPDRADVIIPACEIYLRLMKDAGVERMMVPKIGLADGMILNMFEHWKTNRTLWEKSETVFIHE